MVLNFEEKKSMMYFAKKCIIMDTFQMVKKSVFQQNMIQHGWTRYFGHFWYDLCQKNFIVSKYPFDDNFAMIYAVIK